MTRHKNRVRPWVRRARARRGRSRALSQSASGVVHPSTSRSAAAGRGEPPPRARALRGPGPASRRSRRGARRRLGFRTAPESATSSPATRPPDVPAPNVESRSPVTTPSRRRSCSTSHDSSPNKSQRRGPVPRIGRSSSVSIRINDDFPDPFGPRMAVCSPCRIDNETPWSTRAPPLISVPSTSSTMGASPLM